MIFITATIFIILAIDSYRYDMDSANDVDILEGLGVVITLLIGAFVILYELDLFYTVYYFLLKPKTTARSILHLLSNASLLLVLFNSYYKDIFSEDVIAPLIVFALYVGLRIACLMIPICQSDKRQ